MRERPILFSGPMVAAILRGDKTATRRVVKRGEGAIRVHLPRAVSSDPFVHMGERLPVPIFADAGEHRATLHDGGAVSLWRPGGQRLGVKPGEFEWRSPYGVPGDRLWVKETWQAIHVYTDVETGIPDDLEYADVIPKGPDGWWSVACAADDPEVSDSREDRGFPWRPSLFMPRWASRITLEVTSVRVERLNAISSEDALAEGVRGSPPDVPCGPGCQCHRRAFAQLWDSINGERDGCAWPDDPWVWVVAFKRLP